MLHRFKQRCEPRYFCTRPNFVEALHFADILASAGLVLDIIRAIVDDSIRPDAKSGELECTARDIGATMKKTNSDHSFISFATEALFALRMSHLDAVFLIGQIPQGPRIGVVVSTPRLITRKGRL